MTVSVPDVLTRLGAESDQTPEAIRVLALAQQYVNDYIGNAVVPDPVLDEATLRVAVDLFNRAQAPNGVLMTAYDDAGNGSSVPIRLARDPLWSARDVLDLYVPSVGGFA